MSFYCRYKKRRLPQVKWPKGYVDPPGVAVLREKYLLLWKCRGIRINDFRRALALGLARRHYWRPTLTINGPVGRFRRAHPDDRFGWLTHMKRVWRTRQNPANIEIARRNGERLARFAQRRHQIKKQQAGIVAKGGVIKRQFALSLE